MVAISEVKLHLFHEYEMKNGSSSFLGIEVAASPKRYLLWHTKCENEKKIVIFMKLNQKIEQGSPAI